MSGQLPLRASRVYSAMQNLREAIAGYRGRLVHEGNEGKRNALLMVSLEYLERYYVLIEYSAYVNDPEFDPLSPLQPSFGQWLAARPELRRCAEDGERLDAYLAFGHSD